jgi:hypothetical protein
MLPTWPRQVPPVEKKNNEWIHPSMKPTKIPFLEMLKVYKMHRFSPCY